MSEREFLKIDRRKCRATGKVSFRNKAEALLFVAVLRWRFNHRPKRPDGSRIKRRSIGKPQQRRAYYCPACEGYHLTKWTKRSFDREQKKWDDD